MRIPDNYDLWEAHDIEMERRRMRRPECSLCGEHIQQEDAVCIHGEYICDECLENNRIYIEEDE
jgi:formylmethanofuran dehydrogenase subunit E